eukprot:gene4085-4332_t
MQPPGSVPMMNGPPSGGMMRPPGPPVALGQPGAGLQAAGGQTYSAQQAAAGMQQMSLGGPPGPPDYQLLVAFPVDLVQQGLAPWEAHLGLSWGGRLLAVHQVHHQGLFPMARHQQALWLGRHRQSQQQGQAQAPILGVQVQCALQ